jgi:2-polyprenyl-3-methyl-5-hydroxy-6-metoxy-1,4-benzoquinol methylase
METAPESCLVCGCSEKEPVFHEKSWTIYKCPDCGLGILHPRPSKTELESLYEKEYFEVQYDAGVQPDSPEFKRWMDLLEHRHRFFKRKKSKGNLLDIGCGNGYFLALCRSRGYDVMGIDVSRWAVRYATTVLKLNVFQGELSDIFLPDHQFDVITMFHSMEHTRNPSETLLRIKDWIKPDGILIVEVPNYSGTDAMKQGEAWVGWQIPYHFFHFTPASLTRLLGNHGFEVIKFKDFHSETVKAALKEIPVVSFFARTIAKFFSGHSILVMAQLK